MKLLTITVPCYNSQDYMCACVDSLLAGGDRLEIIIIDDGSKDNTGVIADAYAAKYPNIVKVIHQENGGHGEGINQGLRHATGKYFKVVDSDDQLNADFPAFLDKLEECDRNGGIDLMVTNYYYVHTDGQGDRSINYSSALPEGMIFRWEDTKRFMIHQMLTIHSCTFRTEVMRQCKEDLPKKVFYEDNLMICRTLPFVHRMYYMNVDLYRYTIGREGQSVQDDVSRRRYSHYLQVTEMAFKAVDLDSITSKRQKQYLNHELYMMFAIAILFTRLNKSEECDAALKKMWDNCYAHNPKQAAHFREHTTLWFINIGGGFGRTMVSAVYAVANKVVRFN